MFGDSQGKEELPYIPEQDPLGLSVGIDLRRVDASYELFKHAGNSLASIAIDHEIFPSSHRFNTALFLQTIHKDKTMTEFKTGVTNLSQTLRELEDQQENLVRDHFGLFVKCADGLSALVDKKNEFVPDYDEVAKLDGGKYNNKAEVHLKLSSVILKECCMLSDIFLGPILGKMKLNTKIKRYQSVLRELATIIEYPSLIKEAFKKRDYNLVCTMYEYLRRKFPPTLATRSRVVNFVRTQTKALMIDMKKQIFEKFTAYCSPFSDGNDGSANDITPSDNLNNILVDMQFLQRLHPKNAVHHAFQLQITVVKKNLDAIVTRSTRNIDSIVHDDDSNNESVLLRYNDINESVLLRYNDINESVLLRYNDIVDDLESSSGESNEAKTLQSIDQLFEINSHKDVNSTTTKETNLMKVRRTIGIHEIRQLVQRTLPFFYALLNMMNQISMSSSSITNNELYESNRDSLISQLSYIVKMLKKMIFSSVDMRGKFIRASNSNVRMMYTTIENGASSIVTHMRPILLSMKELLFEGTKIQISSCCQQLSLFGLCMLSFHEKNSERLSRIKSLLENHFSSASSTKMSRLLSYDVAYVHKHFGENRYFVAVYMYEIYALLSLRYMYSLVRREFVANNDNDRSDTNDKSYRTDMESTIKKDVGKSLEMFIISLKRMVIDNIASLSCSEQEKMSNDSDEEGSFENILAQLNPSSSNGTIGRDSKSEQMVQLLETSIFLRFSLLVKISAYFGIYLHNNEDEKCNVSVDTGFLAHIRATPFTMPNYLVQLELLLMRAYVDIFQEKIDQIISNGVGNIKML